MTLSSGSQSKINMTRQWRILPNLLRILCVVGLVMIGFAHKPVLADSTQAGTIVLAALPDGSLPTLCFGETDGRKAPAMAYHGCDACRLSSSFVFVDPVFVAGPALDFATNIAFYPRPAKLARQVLPSGGGARAPPST